MPLVFRSEFAAIYPGRAVSEKPAFKDLTGLVNAVQFRQHDDPDGATAVAEYVDTSTAWSNAAARLYSFRNNAVEKLAVMADGALAWASGTKVAEYAAGGVVLSGTTPMLALGGTSPAFPAWKRSGTDIQARFADDSGFARIYGYRLKTDYTGVEATPALQLGGDNDGWSAIYQGLGASVGSTHVFACRASGAEIQADGQYLWCSANGDLQNNGVDTGLDRIVAGIVKPTDGSTGNGCFELGEMTAPAAPAANEVRLYAVDNGAGKTQLMALFSSGAAQQVAIQP